MAAEELFLSLILGLLVFSMGVPIFGLTLYVIKIGGPYFFLWSWIFLFMTSLVCSCILTTIFCVIPVYIYKMC